MELSYQDYFWFLGDTNQSKSHSGHQQLRFTRNYMGAWRTWRRPPTSSLQLDWSCRRTRRRRRRFLGEVVVFARWSYKGVWMCETKITQLFQSNILACTGYNYTVLDIVWRSRITVEVYSTKCSSEGLPHVRQCRDKKRGHKKEKWWRD